MRRKITLGFTALVALTALVTMASAWSNANRPEVHPEFSAGGGGNFRGHGASGNW